jgi:hypothetical protein
VDGVNRGRVTTVRLSDLEAVEDPISDGCNIVFNTGWEIQLYFVGQLMGDGFTTIFTGMMKRSDLNSSHDTMKARAPKMLVPSLPPIAGNMDGRERPPLGTIHRLCNFSCNQTLISD